MSVEDWAQREAGVRMPHGMSDAERVMFRYGGGLLVQEFADALLSDEAVTVGARALFVNDVPGIFNDEDWEMLTEVGRDDQRRIARVVLQAAVAAVTEGGSDE